MALGNAPAPGRAVPVLPVGRSPRQHNALSRGWEEALGKSPVTRAQRFTHCVGPTSPASLMYGNVTLL